MTALSLSQALALAEQHFHAGRVVYAAAVCRAMVDADPNEHRAWRLLGLAEYFQGHFDAAAAGLLRATELAPAIAEYFDNLSVIRSAQKRFPEAEAAARKALALDPNLYQAASNLGGALEAQGHLEEAEQWLRRALAVRPDLCDALSNLGSVLSNGRRMEEAEAVCRQALAIDPRHVNARINLALALQQQGRLAEAEAAYRQALELQPAHAMAHDDLGTLLMIQGRLLEAHQEHQQAMTLDPSLVRAHSHALWCVQYMAGVTEAELAAAHEQWDRRHAAPLAPSGPVLPVDRTPNRRLRLGFVSADFGRHPVGSFLVRVLENLDRSECETLCYSDRLHADPLTVRLQAAADQWCDSRTLSDAALADRIRADRVDILFDLAGHTTRNRLLVFARRPAPLQATWMGYVGTTGLSTMDYLVADRYEVPPESERHYRERILRLPDGYVCYDPPATAPEVGPLPAEKVGHVTFGSFNNLAKIGVAVVEQWARILVRVPDARLVLKYSGLEDESTRGRYRAMFAQAGIAPARLELLGYSLPDQMLEQYLRIDVALDPFPYSGGLTTCEALWMGVPVITCPGATFAGRHALSHLSHAGLGDLVASDLDDYVGRAVALANDRPRLAKLRRGLRGQLAASPLCDGRRFSQNLMRALREAWHERFA
jgi:predicted O-linked N-acetylglucosamine transferase (SPINDLY family)